MIRLVGGTLVTPHAVSQYRVAYDAIIWHHSG